MGLVDFFNTGDDSQGDFQSSEWMAQTFQASENYDIASVKLQFFRTGSPGTLTVSIRATSGGLPTGSDLASGTFDTSSITTSSPGDWYEISFGTPYSLSSGTTYAIVCRVPSGNGSNYLLWRTDTAAGYANGQRCGSSDSGANWSAVSTQDLMFETYSAVSTNSSTISAKARIEQTGVSKTIQAKGRIEQLGVSSTIQAKARVLRQANSSTISAKAHIQTAGAKTIQAKATIQQSGVDQTIQAKGRIEQQNVEKTVSAKGRISVTGAKTIQAKGRIEQLGVNKTVSAKGRIAGTSDQTIQAKATIVQEEDQTIQARGRIQQTVAKTISAKGRIKLQEKGFVKMRSEQQSWPITLNDNRIL